MTKYRIRLHNGRVIGPFILHQLFELKFKGHIKGNEEAQLFPAGDWLPISSFEFFQELMDENKTVVETERKEETFVIDLTRLRNQVNEIEIENLEPELAAVEELTETIQMSPSEVKLELELDNAVSTSPNAEPFSLELDLDERENEDKTLINPVAQQEIERMRRKQEDEKKRKQQEEEKKIAEEKAMELVRVEQERAEEEAALVPVDESTQMFKLEKLKTNLMEDAKKEESLFEAQLKLARKQEAEEFGEDEEANEEEELSNKKKKRVKILMLIAGLALIYALLFPNEEKPQKPPFQHLPPQIVFPIPYDKADVMKSQAEYNRGVELFQKGGYPNIVKSGLLFKASYENNLDNTASMNLLLRSYGEQLRHSKDKLTDTQTVFNLIQTKRSLMMQDPNGVIGLNLFYTSINKHSAAAEIVGRYLKLFPKNVTQDLFAVYLKSLLKLGRIDTAKQFFTALEKAPEKNRYSLEAIIEYLSFNQEFEKAEEYIDDAIKRNPQLVNFHLMKAESLVRNKKFKEAANSLRVVEELALDYNDINRAKFLELTGLLLAFSGDVKQATTFLKKSLQVVDSNELRMKLADLSTTNGSEAETDKLIAESKAVKFLIQAKDFYDKKSFELALSSAARASDAFPGHIPSDLFLSKIQLKLGLTHQGLKTIEKLVEKYPDNKDINFGLVSAYIDTYKFNDAKTRISVISGTDLKNNSEYASLNAKLYHKMGDSLHAISWLKASLNMNPLNDEDVFLLANILLKRANFDAARTLLNKCIDLDPINPDYRIAYSKLVYETQDDQAAVGYLLDLLDEFGENPKFLAEIAISYYRSGKVKDFIAYKEKLEKLPNKDKALYEFLIKAALLDERYNEIPQLVENLLNVEPGDLESMMTAGKVLYENGKLIDAAKWFKRIQDKLPSYPMVQYYIAKIKFLSGDLDGAMEEVKKDMKDNGENDAGLVFVAQILAEKGEFIEAENTYKRAQKLNPRSYDALIGMADISTKRNNFDQALDLYKRALKQKSDEPIIHKKVGDVYRLLGQGALAIESYKMYLEMNPDAPDKGKIDAYINLMQ